MRIRLWATAGALVTLAGTAGCSSGDAPSPPAPAGSGDVPTTAPQETILSAADLQSLRAFAKCIREHGVPEWPDPKSDGSFPTVGTPLENEGKTQRWFTANDACKQHWLKGVRES